MNGENMSEPDPIALSQAFDSAFANVQRIPGPERRDPDGSLNLLSKKGLLTGKDSQTLRAFLSKTSSERKPSAAAVVEEVDAVLKNNSPESPVAIAILKTIRSMADAQPAAAAEAPGQPQYLLTVPEIDWGAAADGAIEGGGFGGLIGAEVGAAIGAAVGTAPAGTASIPGAAVGAAIGAAIGAAGGAIAGGVIAGLGHGAAGGGGKK
jgi:hypothetical protein